MATGAPKISQSLIDRYAAGPSAARRKAVKQLHENLRIALEVWGDKEFETFLQGSYRNDTAIADINDVDIVALHMPSRSPSTHAEWQSLFDRVARIIRSTKLVTGSVRLGDKCVKYEGALKADVVPAIRGAVLSSIDPVTIYSRSGRSERPNHPRDHYANGVRKQKATNDAYKPTVRLFKRWVRQYPTLNAPSFYVECAVHSVPSSEFNAYLPLSLASVALKLCGYSKYEYVPSVAGDKDILVDSEWRPSDFEKFQAKLLSDAKLVLDAMKANSASEADRLWRLAFGD
jgi:hypothetical protein